MQRPRVGASSSFCEMCKESRVSEGKVNGDETGKQARAQVTRGPGRPWESVCVTGKPPACLSKEATGMIFWGMDTLQATAMGIEAQFWCYCDGKMAMIKQGVLEAVKIDQVWKTLCR